MNPTSNPRDAQLWQRIVGSRHHGRWSEFNELVQAFLAPDVNRVPILKPALRGPGRNAAVFILKFIPTDELLPLFDELVWIASWSYGLTDAVSDAIARLPREWVLQHIEPVIEPILREGDYSEYRLILGLCRSIDRDLTLKIARRALAQDDADIQEAGQDAVDWFAEK